MSGAALLWIGRRAAAPFEALAADYVSRIARFCSFEELRVRPAEGRADARRALALEAERLRGHLKPGDHVVALDERGVERSTEDLSRWLGERLRGPRLVFVIGSDLGLDEEFLKQARELMALSRLTFGHSLARVVLLEQVYRSLDLAAGGSYHRGCVR